MHLGQLAGKTALYLEYVPRRRADAFDEEQMERARTHRRDDVGCRGAQTSQGHAVLEDAGLLEGPASYSELAFTHPSALPGLLGPGRNPVNVSFDIRNVSPSARSYRWSILLVHSGKSELKASGTADAPAQGYVSVARTLPVSCVAERIQVVVRLASPAESIDFWLTCPNRSRSVR